MKNPARLSWFEKLLVGAPIALWFSFQPLIRLGQNETMYFELSIALIYMAVLAVVALPVLMKHRAQLVRQKALWLVGAYLLWVILSLLWTDNLLRGVLTVGVTGMLAVIFAALWVEQKRIVALVPLLARVLFISAVVVSVLALVQLVAGIWLPADVTLLCAGCVAEQFGFARPNVFAIEPQFLGSLLLAPALLGVWLGLQGRFDRWITPGLVLIVTALFLTLSRGAIFAFVLGALVLAVVYRHKIRQLLEVGGVIMGAFLVSLAIQGTAAALNPSVSETFSGAVAKTVNQLSLGLIAIPIGEPSVPASDVPEPVFDGYVEESTDIRVGLTSAAVSIWTSSPFTFFFGVGAGSAGIALQATFPSEFSAREIIQNEYVSHLVELGLVGLGVFAALLSTIVYYAIRARAWLVLAFATAYAFQWLFFSGYPNALHIYFVLGVVVVYMATARRVQ